MSWNYRNKIFFKNQNINTDGLERSLAILVYKGCIYEHDTHQEALLEALSNEGAKIKDINNYDIDKLSDITHSLFKDETKDVNGFDVFSNGENSYLASHFISNMVSCYSLMESYAREHNLILCLFVEFSSKEIYFIDTDKTNFSLLQIDKEIKRQPLKEKEVKEIIEIEKDKSLKTVRDLRENQVYVYNVAGEGYATFLAVKKDGGKLLSMYLCEKDISLLGSKNLDDYIIEDNQVSCGNLRDFESTKLQDKELITKLSELYEHHMTNSLQGNEEPLIVSEVQKSASEVGFADIESGVVYNSKKEHEEPEMEM